MSVAISIQSNAQTGWDYARKGRGEVNVRGYIGTNMCDLAYRQTSA